MKNNKGFSLVELIIVIAIMAILVGVMAPQLIKYIEKTNVSSDTQLADSVKTAITTAMMDPSVISDANAQIPQATTMTSVSGGLGGGSFETAVEEILGFSDTDIEGKLKSTYGTTKASGVMFQIVGSNSVHVQVANSDASGKKGRGTAPTGGFPKIYVD